MKVSILRSIGICFLTASVLAPVFVSCSSGRHCPGVSSTGNYKPNVKNRKEDGLMSAKMQRQMNKNVKAGPIEGKKLQFPQ